MTKGYRRWMLALILLATVIVAQASDNYYIIENRRGGNSSSPPTVGSNVTLIDASECGDASCNTFVEVFT